MKFFTEPAFLLSRYGPQTFTIEGASLKTWKPLLLYLNIYSIQGQFHRQNYKVPAK